MRQSWQKNERYYYRDSARPNYGLMYVISGEIEYTCHSGKVTVMPGQVAYLPKNKKYTAAFKKNTADILINFDAQGGFSDADIGFFTLGGEKTIELFERTEKCGAGDVLKLKSLFYAILSELTENGGDGFTAEINKLTETDEIFGMSEIDLAKHIAFSPSTFRRRFTEKMGMTLSEYRSAARLDKAKRYLSFMTIGEIADRLGFYDRSHFNKFFTAATGESPSGYIKTIRKA